MENYENITALDTDTLVDLGLVQPEEENVEEPVETVEEEIEENEDTVDDEPTDDGVEETSDKFVIDGIGEVTAEEIKEWRQGNLRQSDYTKKTQEIAQLRNEHKEALELYDYLRNNPQILQGLRQVDGANQEVLNTASYENKMLKDLFVSQKSMEIDMKLNELKQKYGDIDEVELFKKASELKTEDLEFVYKALSYDDKKVNESELIEKAKAQLLEEINANKSATSTIISSRKDTVDKQVVTLSAEEKRIASAMGLSEAEYMKWKV